MSNYRTFQVLSYGNKHMYINKTASESAIISAKKIFSRMMYNDDVKSIQVKVIETTYNMPRIEYNYVAFKKPFNVIMLD